MTLSRFKSSKSGRRESLPSHRPPPSTVYRRFIYLDVDGLMNFLSVLRGGEVLERCQVSASESKGGLGAEIELGPIGLPVSFKAGAQKRKALEEQVHLTTTAHSAFAEVLHALDQNRERCVIDSAEKLKGLASNRLIELPYRRVEQIDPEEENLTGERDGRLWLTRRLTGDRSRPPRKFSAILDTHAGSAAIVGDGGYLLVDGDQFKALRHATVVAQVEVPVDDLEEVCGERGANPVGASLRDKPGCVNGGDPYHNTKVLLSPICIYK